MGYILFFYNNEKKSRNYKFITGIHAENDEEAIKQVEVLRKNGNYYYCKLCKTFYGEKIIKKWKK